MCHLAWPLQQRTLITFRVRYQLPWFAASLGKLKGRTSWESGRAPQGSYPAIGDELRGYGGAFLPKLGVQKLQHLHPTQTTCQHGQLELWELLRENCA